MDDLARNTDRKLNSQPNQRKPSIYPPKVAKTCGQNQPTKISRATSFCCLQNRHEFLWAQQGLTGTSPFNPYLPLGTRAMPMRGPKKRGEGFPPSVASTCSKSGGHGPASGWHPICFCSFQPQSNFPLLNSNQYPKSKFQPHAKFCRRIATSWPKFQPTPTAHPPLGPPRCKMGGRLYKWLIFSTDPF